MIQLSKKGKEPLQNFIRISNEDKSKINSYRVNIYGLKLMQINNKKQALDDFVYLSQVLFP